MPPYAFLVAFLALPACIMVLASFRHPGEFGGLAPLWKSDGVAGLTLESCQRRILGRMWTEIKVK